jgi:hypothetical protein
MLLFGSGVVRYPADPEAVTHGWRWYKIEDGKLLSPLAPFRVQLPRDGRLPKAYFVPRAEQIWNMVCMIRDHRWYDFALTFGTVQGPFTRDLTMPRLGSMQSSLYQAQMIFTESTANLAESYDLPVVNGIRRSELDRLEHDGSLCGPAVVDNGFLGA